jgi:hypothetical protein
MVLSRNLITALIAQCVALSLLSGFGSAFSWLAGPGRPPDFDTLSQAALAAGVGVVVSVVFSMYATYQLATRDACPSRLVVGVLAALSLAELAVGAMMVLAGSYPVLSTLLQ